MRESKTVFAVLLLLLLIVVCVPGGWCETPVRQEERDIDELFRNPSLDQDWFTNRVNEWDCQSHAFCEKNRKGMKDLADWVGSYPGQIYIFDYPRSYQRPLVIFGSFYAMVDGFLKDTDTLQTGKSR